MILNWAPSIVPSAVALNSKPGAVPISRLPEVFFDGVIDVIVLYKPIDETVFPFKGPNTVSVLDKPSVPVPVIVNTFSLSFPTLVIETRVPNVEPNAEVVPTFMADAPASEAIWETVLNSFVPWTEFAFTPVIVSVWAFPSTSVPVIVKVTVLLSLALEIIIVEDKFDDAKVDCAPSMVKLPAVPRVSASTNPSESATTEFKPLTKRAVDAVPAWSVEIELLIFSDVPLKRALILLLSGPSTINSPDTIFNL